MYWTYYMYDLIKSITTGLDGTVIMSLTNRYCVHILVSAPTQRVLLKAKWVGVRQPYPIIFQ